MASTASPASTASKGSGRGNGRKGRAGNHSAYRAQLNHTYRHPLPSILLNDTTATPKTFSPSLSALRSHVVSGLAPEVKGVWDEMTGSVWVGDPEGTLALWTRGNFGKGSLSRSEPTYLQRRTAELSNESNTLSPEEVTALRRQERKQFKIARALHAVATVEAAERAFMAGASSPGGATDASAMSLEELEAARPKRPTNGMISAPDKGKARDKDGEIKEDEIVNLEHLQVLPEEVWFLAWALGCLAVYLPNETKPLSLRALFSLLVRRSTSSFSLTTSPSDPPPRPDNPLLVSYAVYHHYRSLGWVVRPGVKFCVDWLLYKRGVVFSHAEFAIVIIPVYSNPSDKDSSPYDLENSGPIDWAWLSTLNRVNSQVKKTLVLSYVTIPPVMLDGRDNWFCGGEAESWGRYAVKEVVLRRFVPARMRD